MDTFEENITKGYIMDSFFRKVIEKMGTHPSFEIKNKIIYTKNRGGKDIVCVPSAILAEMTLRTRILDQAHQVVGHYSPQRTSDYIRQWYWWLHIYMDTEKFCKSCEICTQAKGEYQKPAGKLHLLPISTRPWESIGIIYLQRTWPCQKAGQVNWYQSMWDHIK